jgi:hypothetical protein
MKQMFVCLIFGLVLGFVGGFYFGYGEGKKTFETVETTTTVKGTTQHVELPELQPASVEKPAAPVRPTRPDTVYRDSIIYVRQVVDTAAIIADYELKRNYHALLFDNSFGKLNIDFSTQYNKLLNLKYDYVPLSVVHTTVKEKAWTPFAAVSFSTLGYGGIGGGVFYKDFGVEYMLQYDFGQKATGHSFGVKMRY